MTSGKRLPPEQVALIIRKLEEGYSMASVASMFWVKYSTVVDIWNRTRKEK